MSPILSALHDVNQITTILLMVAVSLLLLATIWWQRQLRERAPHVRWSHTLRAVCARQPVGVFCALVPSTDRGVYEWSYTEFLWRWRRARALWWLSVCLITAKVLVMLAIVHVTLVGVEYWWWLQTAPVVGLNLIAELVRSDSSLRGFVIVAALLMAVMSVVSTTLTVRTLVHWRWRQWWMRRQKIVQNTEHGRVYHAASHLPVAGAIVQLRQRATDEVVAGTVTDRAGRYWMAAPAGTYRLHVEHEGFVFPSQRPSIDDAYDGQAIYAAHPINVITARVPVDVPKESPLRAGSRRYLWQTQMWFNWLVIMFTIVLAILAWSPTAALAAAIGVWSQWWLMAGTRHIDYWRRGYKPVAVAAPPVEPSIYAIT